MLFFYASPASQQKDPKTLLEFWLCICTVCFSLFLFFSMYLFAACRWWFSCFLETWTRKMAWQTSDPSSPLPSRLGASTSKLHSGQSKRNSVGRQSILYSLGRNLISQFIGLTKTQFRFSTAEKPGFSMSETWFLQRNTV